MAHVESTGVEPDGILGVAEIQRAIYLIRGQRVMLDADLAPLYGVQTKVLVQAVKRNLTRFPPDFMFLLTEKELVEWRSQIVISNPRAKMALRRPPYAFTEQGVAMLSSVLRSRRAVDVNIQIMRAFVRLRELMLTHRDLAQKLGDLEKKFQTHDENFALVFEAIRQLLEPPAQPERRIGFER